MVINIKMKVIFLVVVVTILGVEGQRPPPPNGPNGQEPPSPPRDKFFQILQCIVAKYCTGDQTTCMSNMEACAKEVLSKQQPEQQQMKDTFHQCCDDTKIPCDENLQPGQPPSIEHTDEQKCTIMECIMKKNKTFDPYVSCINRSAPQPPAKRRH